MPNDSRSCVKAGPAFDAQVALSDMHVQQTTGSPFISETNELAPICNYLALKPHRCANFVDEVGELLNLSIGNISYVGR